MLDMGKKKRVHSQGCTQESRNLLLKKISKNIWGNTPIARVGINPKVPLQKGIISSNENAMFSEVSSPKRSWQQAGESNDDLRTGDGDGYYYYY